jgi:hypothetical protein
MARFDLNYSTKVLPENQLDRCSATREQTYNKKYQKHDKTNLRDQCRRPGNYTEPEKGRDERNHQKQNAVV